MSVRSLLLQGPSQNITFMEDPSASELAVQLTAFANTAGGTIILGMGTEGRVGYDSADFLEPLFLRALDLCRPPFRVDNLPEWNVQDVPDGQIVVVRVPYGGLQKRSVENKIYVRTGMLNIPLSPEKLVPATNVSDDSFEEASVAGATLDDLDEEIIAEYERNRVARGPRGEVFTRSELLRDAGAIDQNGNPTRAGILLFAKHPQFFMPQVGVVIIRFRGTSIREAASSSERYSRRVEIIGPAARVVENTWSVLLDEMQHQPVMDGLERRENYAYPIEAVREAVVNAICHRDYAVSGQRIEIRLFDDRMEIMSPGGLPGHITLDNILDEHYSRNPRLVRGLYYWGYIEELGQGIDIIYDAMRRDHHPDPELHDTRRSFSIILRNEVQQVQADYEGILNDRQLLAMRYISEHGRLSQRQYRQLCPQTSESERVNDLETMVEQGLLLRIGSERGVLYVVK